MNILDKIVASTRERVAREKIALPPGALGEQARPRPNPFAFEQALAAPGISFICEVKKASPSKGLIAPDFPYVDIARDYQVAGAAAVSVLTEPEFFQGADSYLREIRQAVDIPLLRKDFTVDEYQILQAAAMGADAVLLICAVLSPTQLRTFRELADTLGLSCLVEAHDEAEVHRAVEAGARIIGVNNRNLKTFTVDVNNSVRLRKLAPREVLFVSESGISTPADIRILVESGVDGALIGETLMRSPDKAAMLGQLRGECI